MQAVSFTLNREPVDLLVEPYRSLLDVLRNDAGLTGAKKGCDVGDCGACTVFLDGAPVNACLVLGIEARGRKVVTVEGLAPEPGRLDPLQESFLRHGAAQCGFCTPGILMMARALLDETPDADEDDIRFALAGNICRCTGYTKIVEAVRAAAASAGGGG